MYLPLLALAAAAFGIGTTEFVIMGLLPEVAQDFGISVPTAGMLVSGYAIGVTLGAPILAVLTAKWQRKQALVALMVLFTIGNICCALAPTYELLMAARVLTAFCHAAFFGIGAVVAADIVPHDKRAQAVALMFTGLTVANVLGVPLGTALGQALGWRATFWAVTLIGLVAIGSLSWLLPKQLPQPAGVGIISEFRAILGAQTQLALLLSTLASVSMFSVFTYIAYILRDVTGFTPEATSWVLLLFGAGITVGGLIGGRFADHNQMKTLTWLFPSIALVLTLFTWTSHYKVATLATMFIWGFCAFAVVPAIQVRIVDQARGAPNLASTLNQGAFNLGNAIGAWLGGTVIALGIHFDKLPWFGAASALLALTTVRLAGYLERGSPQHMEPRPADVSISQ